jgi:hypothetical protein
MSVESSSSSAGATAGPLMTLRIIVFALAMGVTTFAGFAVSQNLNKPHVVGGKLDALGLVFLALGLVALPLGIIMPRVIFAASRRGPAMNLPAGFPPEQARVFHVQQRIQTSAIIGCAIFEGAAFANTFAYMQSRDLVFLAMTGVLVVGILAHFPTLGSYLRRIEDELRRMDEEELLRRPG